MSLSEKHRSTIYRRLVPVLGEEEAQALMSQFPATDLDVPVTKDFVRAELAEQIGALRVETHDLLRRQTAWIIGTGSGVVVAIAAVTELLG